MSSNQPKFQRVFTEGNLSVTLNTFSEPTDSQIMLARLTAICSSIGGGGKLIRRVMRNEENYMMLDEESFRKCYSRFDDDSRRLILRTLYKAKPYLGNLKLEFPFSPDVETPVFGASLLLPFARNPESALLFEKGTEQISLIPVGNVAECDSHIDCSAMLLTSMVRNPTELVNYIYMCINAKIEVENLLGMKLRSKSPIACVDKLFYRSKGLNDVLRCKISGRFTGSMLGVISETNALGYVVYNKTFTMISGGAPFPVNVEIQTDVLAEKSIEPDHVKYELSRLIFDSKCLEILGSGYKLARAGSVVTGSGKSVSTSFNLSEKIERVNGVSSKETKSLDDLSSHSPEQDEGERRARTLLSLDRCLLS